MADTLRQQQVNKDLAKKLKLEKTFKPEVISIFQSILSGFKTAVFMTGVAPDAAFYRDRWSAILKKHYERTQKKFRISVSLENKQAETEEDLTAELLFLLTNWTNENGKIVSDILTQTTQNNMNDAINQARNILIKDEERVDNRSLARLATIILRRKFSGRVEGIITSETQFAAENTKNTTADVFNEGIQRRGRLPVSVVTKSWHTVGDKLVRPTHKAANNQNRIAKQAFDVGSQKLMFPGDKSLGATAKETSNCRCSSVLFVAGNMLNFHQ